VSRYIINLSLIYHLITGSTSINVGMFVCDKQLPRVLNTLIGCVIAKTNSLASMLAVDHPTLRLPEDVSGAELK